MEFKRKYILFLSLVCIVLFSTHLGKAADQNQESPLLLLGVAPSVRLQVVWIENIGSQYGLYYSIYDNQKWQTKQLVFTSDTLLVTPCIGSISSNANQGNILVWSGKSESSMDLYYSLYQKGTWSTPKKIETNLVSNLSPSLVTDKNNKVWLAWVGNDGGNDDIFFSRWSGSQWEAPVKVNENNDTPDIFPVLGIGSSGYPWIQWNGYQDGHYIQFRKDWNGSSWEDRQEMTGRAVALAGLQLAQASASGTGTVTSFATQDSTNQTSIELPAFIPKPEQAVVYIPGGQKGIQSLPLRDFFSN